MPDEMYSIDWIAHHADRSPGSIACVDVHSGREFAYAEFDDRISRLSNALRHRFKIPVGGRVLVLSRNDADVFGLQFACHRASATFVPLNWRLSSAELELIAKDAVPSILFYGSEFRNAAERMAAASCIDVAIEMLSGAQGEFEEELAKSSNRRPELLHRRGDIWALLYTSGTTGRPKGAQITFGMALCNAIVLGQQFRIGEDSRNLVSLPTFHTAGLNVFANPVFFAGGTNLVVREFDAPLIIDLLRGQRGAITHLMGVPTTHSMLVETPGFDEIGRTVREVCVAGAPCPVSTIKSYANVGLALRQCWGMTEVGPLGLFMPRRPPEGKEASSGRPGIFARYVVADADGRALPDGEIGELLVKGPAVTSGYWEKPEANAAAFNADGWFRTGDASYRDKEGYFFIVDRWKDMYISGGENVYPAEIERTLDQLDEILECAVVGMSDPKWGEVGCAFVVQKSGATAEVSELQHHCEQRLARYKIPKKFVFVDQLPRNASGKVLKAQLKQRVLQIS